MRVRHIFLIDNCVRYAAFAGAVVFLLQCVIIASYANNFPFWDEWELADTLRKYLAGSLSMNDIFAQHNEHNVAVVRLLCLLAFYLMGNMWHPVASMLVSALLVAVLAGVWIWAINKLGLLNWWTALSCVCLVSLVQYENIISGFQIAFYAMMLAVAGGTCALALSYRLTRSLVAVSLVCVFVAIFSLVSGLMLSLICGIGLLLIALREAGSLRELLRNRYLVMNLGFALVGIVLIVWLFFANYRMLPVDRTSNVSLLAYFLTALSFPFVKSVVDTPLQTKVISSILIWGPVVAIIPVLLRHRRSVFEFRALLLLSGIAAFVIGFIILIAFGRSDPFISPRYGTVLVWSSMLGLLALAVGVRLMEAIRSSAVRRVAVLACNVWAIALLSANINAALVSVDEMRRHADWRLAKRDATLALLVDSESVSDTPLYPDREKLKRWLLDAVIQNVLPFEMSYMLPGQWTIVEGNAWTLNGEFPAQMGKTPFFRLGSWSGNNVHMGTVVLHLPPIREQYLVLPVSGYPTHPGNLLALEIMEGDNQKQTLVYTGVDPHERWDMWIVDMQLFQGRTAQIVAIDKSQDRWLAVGAPRQLSFWGLAAESFVENIVPIASVVFFAVVAICFYEWHGFRS
jgi:hypothetical protein